MATPIPMPENLNVDMGATSGNGDFWGGSRSNTWNFAPPQYQVMAQNQRASGQNWTNLIMFAGALGAVWLLTKK